MTVLAGVERLAESSSKLAMSAWFGRGWEDNSVISSAFMGVASGTEL